MWWEITEAQLTLSWWALVWPHTLIKFWNALNPFANTCFPEPLSNHCLILTSLADLGPSIPLRLHRPAGGPQDPIPDQQLVTILIGQCMRWPENVGTCKEFCRTEDRRFPLAGGVGVVQNMCSFAEKATLETRSSDELYRQSIHHMPSKQR